MVSRQRAVLVVFSVAAGLGAGLGFDAEAPAKARPPWACDPLEQPRLDRRASRLAKPFPYKDPGWIFRLVGSYARVHRGDYAGFYFDTSPKGKGNPMYFHLLFDENVVAHARAVRARAKDPTAIRFSRAPVSLRELGEVSRRISHEQFDSDPPDPDLGAVAIYLAQDEPTNSLEVGLENYSREAAAAFHQRYGPRLCVKLHDAEPAEFLGE